MLNIPKEALTVKNRGVRHRQLSTIFYVKKSQNQPALFLIYNTAKKKRKVIRPQNFWYTATERSSRKADLSSSVDSRASLHSIFEIRMCFLSLFPLLCSAWFPRSEAPNEWFKYCKSNTSSLSCGMSLYCDGSIAFLGVKQLQEDKWLHCFLQFLLTSVHYIEMNRARKKVLCRIANWHYSPYLALRQSALWRYYKIKQKSH